MGYNHKFWAPVTLITSFWINISLKRRVKSREIKPLSQQFKVTSYKFSD